MDAWVVREESICVWNNIKGLNSPKIIQPQMASGISLALFEWTVYRLPRETMAVLSLTKGDGMSRLTMRGLRLTCVSVALLALSGVPAFADGEGSSPDEQGTMGQVLLGSIASIDGEQYAIRNEDGNTVKYHVSKDSMLNGGEFQAGDQVIGSVTKDGHVIALTKRLSPKPGA